MKMSILSVLFILPSLSFAGNTAVSAESAASLVRQAGVEKCLAIVENNQKGLAYFNSITDLGTKMLSDRSETKYSLKGSNLSGDIMMGDWEIIVTNTCQGEVGCYTDCKVTKNLK